jgi:hypothetical protein
MKGIGGSRWAGESRTAASLCKKSCLRANKQRQRHAGRHGATAPKVDESEGGASYDYDEYGVSMTREEEKARIQQIMKLLYSGHRLEEEMSKAIESGEVDEKTLAVLHHKIRKVAREGQQKTTIPSTNEEEDDTTLRALSILYTRLQQEYRKRNISPSMKLLSDALDVMLEEEGEGEGEGETERLLRVKDLLDEHFVQPDLGLDPISAASIFAQAEKSKRAQVEIDSYLRGRMPKSEFVAEVEERLQSLREEFAALDRREAAEEEEKKTRQAGNSLVDSDNGWIENIQKQNLHKTQKMQREKILKYLKYIIELANHY